MYFLLIYLYIIKKLVKEFVFSIYFNGLYLEFDILFILVTSKVFALIA